MTGERRRDWEGVGVASGDSGTVEGSGVGLTSFSSMEKDTVLRRFLRGGKMGDEGRGQGGEDGRRSVGPAAVVFSSVFRKQDN